MSRPGYRSTKLSLRRREAKHRRAQVEAALQAVTKTVQLMEPLRREKGKKVLVNL